MAARKKTGLTFDNYTVVQDMSPPERVAHFLDWCARKMPYRYVPYPYIMKVVQVLKRKPAEDNEEVRRFARNRMTRPAIILREQYNRALVRAPGLGARATTDAEDKSVNDLIPKVKRTQSSIRATDVSASNINENEIKDPEIRAMVKRIKGGIKTLTSDTLSRQLQLPPKRPDSPDDKGKPSAKGRSKAAPKRKR
jgi:hypothetical protein